MKDFIPTKDFYDFLQELYQVFNKELFADELPNCLITVQRRKRVMGYFSANRWVNNDKEIKVHELALNPTYFASCNFIELFQTIVHEMCHLWQFEYGKPSVKTYHNKGYLGTFGKNATKNFKLTLKSDTLLYEPLELIFPYKDTLSTPKTISSSIS